MVGDWGDVTGDSRGFIGGKPSITGCFHGIYPSIHGGFRGIEYLVGGLVAIFGIFPEILGIIIPIDVHILQRGGPTTNQ